MYFDPEALTNRYRETRHVITRRPTHFPGMKAAILSRRAAEEDMADYSNVAPPSSNSGGGMNDAFKDALQRARQVGRPVRSFHTWLYINVDDECDVFVCFSAVAYGVRPGYAKLS